MKLVERTTCPACGVAGGESIYERSYEEPDLLRFLIRHYSHVPETRVHAATRGLVFRLVHCRACDLTYQRGIPDSDSLRELYDVWCDPGHSEAKSQSKVDGSRSARLLQQVMILIDLVGGKPSGLRALDFGAGWGSWCSAAQAFGIQTAACELAVDRREALNAKGIPILDLTELESASFDIINCDQVFEHLVDPSTIAERLATALRPGGVLRISVPSGELARLRLRVGSWDASKASPRSMHFVTPLEHVNAFTPRSLKAVCSRHGLAPVSPGIAADYRHLVVRGSLAKAMLRPLYFRLLGRNLTMFFRR